MNLDMLKANSLTKKELKAINAAAAPDCEPGSTKTGRNGLIWVCNTYCAWELASPADEE